MVYQGISQPIFAFRRAMSACDAREAKTRGGVAGVQMGEVGDLVGIEGAAAAGVVGPAGDLRLEEGAR
jgi:hypothetical protein